MQKVDYAYPYRESTPRPINPYMHKHVPAHIQFNRGNYDVTISEWRNGFHMQRMVVLSIPEWETVLKIAKETTMQADLTQ